MDVTRAVGAFYDTRLIRFTYLGSLLAVFMLSGCGKSNSSNGPDLGVNKAACATQQVQNRYIVRWKNGTTSFASAESEEIFRREFLTPNQNDIALAEHDYKIQLPKQPSRHGKDSTTEASETWGQTDSRAAEVWAKGVTGSGITVAVVDTGAYIANPQLAGQLAVNPHEIPANGIDDDGNGYVDDVSGYDFNGHTATMTDGAGHGTHVSGIIAADPTKGPVQGMAPGAKILPLRFMDDTGAGYVSDTLLALKYAEAQGAKIINASWGGDQCSQALKLAIQDLGSHGILFVAAAGNGDSIGNGLNLDVTPEYPAAYDLPNQITVAAITSLDIMAGFSNYSPDLVNIAAPGVNIVSTWSPTSVESPDCVGQLTCSLDGTSMATPFVAGAAALIWSAHPTATVAQVKTALLTSADTGDFQVSSGGKLNVLNALNKLATLVP